MVLLSYFKINFTIKKYNKESYAILSETEIYSHKSRYEKQKQSDNKKITTQKVKAQKGSPIKIIFHSLLCPLQSAITSEG